MVLIVLAIIVRNIAMQKDVVKIVLDLGVPNFVVVMVADKGAKASNAQWNVRVKSRVQKHAMEQTAPNFVLVMLAGYMLLIEIRHVATEQYKRHFVIF